MKKLRNGKHPPVGLFLDDRSPYEISVNRLTPKPNQAPPDNRPDLAPDTVIEKISAKRIDDYNRANGSNQKFYCWAELLVKDVKQNGRTVSATPKENNLWHADIVLPAEAKSDEIIRQRHALELARISKWRPRPTRKQDKSTLPTE